MTQDTEVVQLARESGTVDVEDDVSLTYRLLGEGEETLVFLHGGPGFSSEYFLPDMEPLARQRRLLLYDQRSSGWSTMLAENERNTIDRFVQDLDAIREAFDLETMSLLGHSWGSYLAVRYAIDHPDRIDRMVLIGSMGPAEETYAPEFNPAGRLSASERNLLRTFHDDHEGDPADRRACWDFWAIYARGYHSTPTNAMRMWGDICNREPATIVSDQPNVGLGFPDDIPDLRPHLDGVEAPTLVMHSDDGPIPNAAAEAWAEGLPNASLFFFDRGGHNLWIDRPEVFFPAVDAFLRGATVHPPDPDGGWSPPSDIPEPASSPSEHDALFVEIEAASQRLAASINDHDWQAVAACFTEDGMVMPPSSRPARGRRAIATAWEITHERGQQAVQLHTVEVEGFADRAIETGKFVAKGDDDITLDVGKYMVHWVRTDDGWRLHRDVFNSSLETRSPLELPHYLPPPDGTYGL